MHITSLLAAITALIGLAVAGTTKPYLVEIKHQADLIQTRDVMQATVRAGRPANSTSTPKKAAGKAIARMLSLLAASGRITVERCSVIR
jgi:hypothetical protein